MRAVAAVAVVAAVFACGRAGAVDVRRMQWRDGSTTAFDIAAAREPVVVRGSPFQAALGRLLRPDATDDAAAPTLGWAQLAHHRPLLEGARQQAGHPVFVLRHNTDAAADRAPADGARSGTGAGADGELDASGHGRPQLDVDEDMWLGEGAVHPQMERLNASTSTFAEAAARGDGEARGPAATTYTYHASRLSTWPEAIAEPLRAASEFLVLPDPDPEFNAEQPEDDPDALTVTDDDAARDKAAAAAAERARARALNRAKSARSTRSEVLLWLSTAGVTAQTHYDRTENFFCQVLGTKRVRLMAPTAAQQLQLFPATHPSYRQSQVGLPRGEDSNGWLDGSVGGDAGFGPDPLAAEDDAVDEGEGGDDSTATVFDAVLGPGDVLYIPPFWFHRVQAVTTSLSLSVVTPSEEEVVWSRAYWQRVPFGAPRLADDRAARIVAARALITALLRKVYPSGGDAVAAFASDLLRARYLPLYMRVARSRMHAIALEEAAEAEAEAMATGDSGRGEELDVNAVAVQAVQLMSCSLPQTFDCAVATGDGDAGLHAGARGQVMTEIGAQLDTAASAMAKTLAHDALGGTEANTGDGGAASGVLAARGAAVRRTLLQDYVEEVAAWAVGACNVGSFLLACLT